MSILTETVNGVTSAFTGKAIVYTVQTSRPSGTQPLPVTILLESCGLQGTTLLHFRAAVTIVGSSYTIIGSVGINESVTGYVGGVQYTFSYDDSSLLGASCLLSIDTLQGFDVELTVGNTASLNSNTDVLFAEGEWATFPYSMDTSIESNSYAIPIYRESGSNLISGQLRSPYWLPLQVTIKVGSNTPKRGFWNFSLGCYIEENGTQSTSNYLCRVEWNTLRIRTNISTTSTVVITGSHWIAICPNVAYAPPKLAGYNKGLLSYSGRLLIHRRDYTTSGASCLSNTDTRYINNCYDASQVGWDLQSNQHTPVNISSSSTWGNTTLSSSSYASTNGFAAPSPYWESAQPAQGIITDPVTTMALKSNNAVAAIQGVFYSRYSNLIPMFIHNYNGQSAATVKWISNNSVNPIAAHDLDSHTYISKKQIIGADSETCMLYAYNSNINVLSFADFDDEGGVQHRKGIESAICGDFDNSIEFYIDGERYCIKYDSGDTWTTQINKSINNMYTLKHYGLTLEAEQYDVDVWRVKVNGNYLQYADDTYVDSGEALIEGEHYKTDS